MRKFKCIDIMVSTILICISAIINLTVQNMDWAFVEFFVIAAWQCMSMAVHAFKGWFLETGSKRVVFGQCIGGIFIIINACMLFAPLAFIIPDTLQFALPVIFCCYLWICFHEWHYKMRRPISLLK